MEKDRIFGLEKKKKKKEEEEEEEEKKEMNGSIPSGDPR